MYPEKPPNPGRSLEDLATRLRALNPPPVPAGLEGRLLAAIPKSRPPASRRRQRWLVALGGLVAACFLGLLAWQWKGSGRITAIVPAPPLMQHQAARPPDDSASLVHWRQVRRLEDVSTLAPFRWPLQETALRGTWRTLPPDLLD